VVGWTIGRVSPRVMATPAAADEVAGERAPLVSDDALHHAPPSLRRAAVILSVGLPLWLGPVALAYALTGSQSVYTEQGLFFGGTALVTFGGAYAVLAFVAERAVETYGWLSPGEMVRGLALAETTPGPLIMVVQFVAFLGAFRDPGALNPWVAGVVASLLTTWVTFVPCFLFIFLGAPYVERLRGNASLSAALTGITAAVVGVIANLAVYFASHTLFAATTSYRYGPIDVELPDLSTLEPVPALIAAAALVMTFRLRWSVLRTLGVCAALGLLGSLVS
ncbi:MAG: chromate transporter, partial [Nocardioidaceae bacterium]